MRIEPSPDHDVRVTHWDVGGNILTLDLTWAEWDKLVADADHLRTTGQLKGT